MQDYLMQDYLMQDNLMQDRLIQGHSLMVRLRPILLALCGKSITRPVHGQVAEPI